MMGFERSDDYQPLFWVAGRPVHVTPLLVFMHIAALLVCSMLQGLPVPYLALSSDAVFHHWALWQPLTYAFDHILNDLQDTITFILEMVLLFQWGREVERYFGRKIFITLYLAMLVTAPVVLLTYASVGHFPIIYWRSGLLHFGVFVAFTTIYPNVQFFWGIASKWVALAVAVLLSAAFFSRADYGQLMVLWCTVAVAYFGVRYASVGSEAFSFLGNLRERLPRKTAPRGVRPRLKPRRAVDTAEPAEPVGAVSTSYRAFGDVHESIDPLLDKISKHGLASLTHSERATLERARVSLLRKDRGG